MFVSSRVVSHSQGLLAPLENNFADETPEQQVLHREIERKYRRKPRGSKPVPFPYLRKGDLQRLFADRCGGRILSDDDAGRDYLRLMADHLAQLSEDHVRWWASAWAPWIGDDELDTLIEDVGPGKYWKPGPLGRELNLNDETRTRLKIKTFRAVDCTQAQRAERNKAKDAEAARLRRAKAGAKPHALSEARLKPWIALGMSESTYRRKKRQNEHDSNSSGIILRVLSPTNRCQGAPPPFRGGSEARAVSGAKSREVLLAGLDGESLSGTARARVPLTRQRNQPTPAPATRQ